MGFNLLNGIFSIVFGIILLVFHNRLGAYTTKFQKKYMDYTYSEFEKKFSKTAFMALGLFFTIFGIVLLFQVIQLH